jgi:dUTP pyrophosphatase
MQVKIKKLIPEAFIPEKATPYAAGYDIKIPKDYHVMRGRQVIPLGFAIQLPEFYKAVVDPRSGFSSKGMEGYLEAVLDEEFGMIFKEQRRFDCDVKHGLIDCDYRGCCGVILNNRDEEFWLPAGSRIAQMVITKYEDVEFSEADQLDDTERGTGGFGHTNEK